MIQVFLPYKPPFPMTQKMTQMTQKKSRKTQKKDQKGSPSLVSKKQQANEANPRKALNNRFLHIKFSFLILEERSDEGAELADALDSGSSRH